MVRARGGPLPSGGSRQARFPAFRGTMKPLRLPAVRLPRLMVSPRGPAWGLVFRTRRSAPGGAQARRRAWSLVSRCSAYRQCPRGHKRDLSGFLVTHPVPLPCSKTPAESVVLAIADCPMLPPVPNTPKASALP